MNAFPSPPREDARALPCGSRASRHSPAFSLVELLLSITVLSVLLLMVISLLEATQRTWVTAKTRVGQFRDARVAFESMTRNLSQSTLNTHLDYFDENGERIDPQTRVGGSAENRPIEPDHYDRFSKLHFLVDYAKDIIGDAVPTTTHALFFQATLGNTAKEDYRVLGNLLNSRGYFIAYTSDEYQRPAFLQDSVTPRFRFRLMEYRPPSERNQIYVTPDDYTDWFGKDFQEIVRNSRVIADNVVALVISPLTSADEANTKRFDIAPQYKYSSQPRQGGAVSASDRLQRHQLPPLVKVTMVAIDEESALRLQFNENTTPDILFPDGPIFEDASKFDEDLQRLEEFLAKSGAYSGTDGFAVNYRVFSGTVSIRGAKWSDESLIAVPGGP